MTMLVFVSCLVIFVYGMLSSLLGTIIPGLGDALHLTNSEIGFIGLAQGFGLAGMSVVAGALMDRNGKKIGVAAGLGATILGLLPNDAALGCAMLPTFTIVQQHRLHAYKVLTSSSSGSGSQSAVVCAGALELGACF